MARTAPTEPQTPAEYRAWWAANAPVPYGYCWCGCGEQTSAAKQSVRREGVVRGEPKRYLPYHHKRVNAIPEPNPSGLCLCGCGNRTNLAPQNHRADGLVKGKPLRYLPGHYAKAAKERPERRKLRNYEKAEVLRRYVAGETTYALAHAFGVSNTTIGKMLTQEGVERRMGSEAYRALRSLSDTQELEVCRRYKAGETAKSIAGAFGVSATTILKVLDRWDVPRNNRAVYPSAKRVELRVLPAVQEAEVCRRYMGGESIPTIAKTLGVGVGAVNGALERNGVEKRPGVSRNPVSPEQEREICQRYLAGEWPKAISKATGVGHSTIPIVLKRNGIEPKVKIRYTADQETRAHERYVSGEAVNAISEVLGISPAGIYFILRRRGVEPTRNPRRLEWEETEAAKVIRSLPAYRKWRQAVLKRDGRACQECGAHSTCDNPLHVHHLLAFSEILTMYRPVTAEDAERYAALWDVGNGVTLCGECHREAHRQVELHPLTRRG